MTAVCAPLQGNDLVKVNVGLVIAPDVVEDVADADAFRVGRGLPAGGVIGGDGGELVSRQVKGLRAVGFPHGGQSVGVALSRLHVADHAGRVAVEAGDFPRLSGLKINLVADAEQYGLVIGHVYIPPCHELKWSAAVTRKALAAGRRNRTWRRTRLRAWRNHDRLRRIDRIRSADGKATWRPVRAALRVLLRRVPQTFRRLFPHPVRRIWRPFRIGQHWKDKRFAVAGLDIQRDT